MKRQYSVVFKYNNQELSDVKNTFELILFIIYSRFSKKIKYISILEVSFIED